MKEYPYYHAGAGYILSGTLASMLSEWDARFGLKYSTMEDATVGAWLMPVAGIVYAHSPRIFTLESLRDTASKLKHYENTVCDLSTSPLIVHKASPHQLKGLSVAVSQCAMTV